MLCSIESVDKLVLEYVFVIVFKLRIIFTGKHKRCMTVVNDNNNNNNYTTRIVHSRR